jgi:DNA-binding transcriptional LysR family regulator
MEYPKVEIYLMEGIAQEILSWLDSGEADLAIMPDMEEAGMEWIPLADDPMVAVLPKEHPKAGADVYPLQCCGEESFIMPALGHDVDVEKLLEKNGIHPHIVFTTMENPVMLSMIRSGMGMSVMNRLCTTMWKDELAILPLDPPSKITFGIVLSPNHHLSPVADKLTEYVLRMLTRPPKP